MGFKVLHTEWSNGWGGQEIRIFEDLRMLNRLGHEAMLLTVPGSGIGAQAAAAGMRVVEMDMNHSFQPAALWKMVRLFRDERFDIINTHSSVDSWLASAAFKLVRGGILVRTRHLSVPLNTHMFNMVYRWPDGFVTTAEVIRRRMIDVNGMDPDRVISIPTGVDLERF